MSDRAPDGFKPWVVSDGPTPYEFELIECWQKGKEIYVRNPRLLGQVTNVAGLWWRPTPQSTTEQRDAGALLPPGELTRRVEMLERIVIAMCSGQHFTVSLDKDGRPQFGETPRHHAHGGPPFSDVFMAIKNPQDTKEG